MIENRKRYNLIDAIRGVSLVSMILFHLSFDIFIVYGRNPYWYRIPAVHAWQQSICWTFILVSGFVWQWGRSGNLKRGIMINLCGFVITGVTLLVMPDEVVWFGILNFMGCAILLMFPLEKLLRKIPNLPGLLLFFLLFRIFRRVDEGILGLGNLFQMTLPAGLYTTKILTPLGFPFPSFFSSDYFPILPWMFLYICGWYLNRLFLKCEPLKKLATKEIPVLSFIGRKTIWVYMIHQPVCMGLCVLVFDLLLKS